MEGSLCIVRILLLLLEHPLLLHLCGHHASLNWKHWGLASYACLGWYAWLGTRLRHYARLLRHHACLLRSSRACTNNLFHRSCTSVPLHLQPLDMLNLLRSAWHLCEGWMRVSTPSLRKEYQRQTKIIIHVDYLGTPEARCSRTGHPVG